MITDRTADGAMAVLRGWRNDGADGESAHLVCDYVTELRIKNEILTMVALAVLRDLESYRNEFPNGTRFALTEIALQRLERSRTQPEGEQ
jgi:hypothetical protein